MTAASYNELMGIGVHSEDANLEGWWLLQEDSADSGSQPSIVDQSSNGIDGTLVGDASHNDTSEISTTGPNSWLTKALDFDGSTNYINLNLSTSLIPANGTLMLRCEGFSQGVMIGKGVNNQVLFFVESGALKLRIVSSNTLSWTPGATPTGWHSYVGKWSGTSGVIISDGSVQASGTVSGIPSANGTAWRIGQFDGAIGGYYLTLPSAEAVVFSRSLDTAECADWHNGPELNYTSGVSFGDDGAYDVGTWALPSPFASGSNGSATYEVIAVNAAGSVLDSDTTATGTLDLSSEAGNTCYLLARVSNTGGYDIGDHATRTSGYGSANDGYYEIASVTAASGGGGATPWLYMQRSGQLIGGGLK